MKKLLTFILCVFLTNSAFAGDQVLFGGTESDTSHGDNVFLVPNSSESSGSNERQRKFIVAADGNIKNLFVELRVAPGGGEDRTFTLSVDGSPTALTVTFGAADTSQSDTSNPVAVTAGQTISLKHTTVSGSPAATHIDWSIVFDSTTTAETILGGNTGSNDLHQTSTRYFPSSGMGNQSFSNQSIGSMVCPTSGTISDLYVELENDPNPGNYTFTMTKDTGGGFGDQSLTTAITSGNTTNNDTSNSFTVNAGDLITLKIAPDTNPTVGEMRYGIKFTTDNDGEFVIPFVSGIATHNTNTEYNPIVGVEDSWNSTEANRQTGGQSCTIKSIYVAADGTPGAGNSYTFTLQQDNGGSALNVVLSDAETADNNAQDVTLNNFEVFGTECVPDSTPSTRKMGISYLGFISLGVVAVEPAIFSGSNF